MIKEYVSKGFWYFIYLFSSLWIAVFVYTPCQLVINFFTHESRVVYTIAIICMTITTCISLFVCTFRNGYKEGVFRTKAVLIPVMIAFVFQMIYAILFSFSLYTAGPAFYAGATHYLLQGGTKLGVPDEFVFPYMLLFDILYIFVFLAGEYFGVKKRNKDRETLISQNNK